MALNKIKGGKHPQKVAEAKRKKRADKNAQDPKLIKKTIEGLKNILDQFKNV